MDKKIPRDPNNDYSLEIVQKRQKFIEEKTGVKLEHISKFSFDPQVTRGNIENFTGVAQVPIGFAGPLLVHGEYAQGEFYVPLATTEGTLVASYNRGMKVLHMSGGIKTTISGDSMQRAPVFVFEDARGARDFGKWVDENFETIKQMCESTTRFGKLINIEQFHANKFMFLRFNFTTGDAAGQNMVGRATYFGCEWIKHNYPGKIIRYYLESNFATDKKGSQINTIRTRGKRVTAEAVVKKEYLEKYMRTSPESIHYHHQVANVGGFMSHVNNNGCHSANAITAIFIATGQDVANVSESSAGVVYAERTEEDDLYLSITIPSLIVATYGGGTGLPTQKECLEILGCFGKGKVNKFAEIVAAAVLAGELSLASAISSLDWVSSHEQYGRNR
ncbi:MAG: hydroxymethylglutaryl-CoA reductase [Planctomycetota bacterium]|nr:MAG: hydroxymethylglutaryl-CoA reductase [Planctomycetota bacterium]